MMDTPLQPMIPRSSSGLVAVFVLVAILGAIFISREYWAASTRSEAEHLEPVLFAWVPISVRGEVRYYSLSADELLLKTYLSPPDPAVHVAIVGETYHDLDLFHDDAASFAELLAVQSPLSAGAQRLIFHYLDQPQEFGCQVGAHIFSCDYPRVLETLRTAGVPADYVVILRHVSRPALSPAGARVYDIKEQKERAFYEKLP